MVGTFYTKYMYKTFKKVTVDHFSYNLASLKWLTLNFTFEIIF